MIQVNELRIGNLVSIENKPYIITSGDIYNLDCYYKNYIQFYHEIPLTEEWLVMFGFTKRKFSYLWGFGNFLYDERLKLWTWYGIQLHDYLIQYVHQIQNLYFALTGEELKLNDK